MRFVKNIVIHCSAGYGTVESVKAFWKNKLGWKDVGYHFYIDEDGTVHQLATLDKVTNGVLGQNASSVHISYKGGVNRKDYSKAEDSRTEAQKCAIVNTINKVIAELKATQSTKDIKILGHRDFSPDSNGNGVIEKWERIKECPSYDAIPEYKSIKR